MSPKSRLLIIEAVLPAQTEVGGDMGGYLIDVSDSISSMGRSILTLNEKFWVPFFDYRFS